MADNGSASATPTPATPATQAPATGNTAEAGQFKAPDGYALVPQAEFDGYKRDAGRFKGSEKFYSKLASIGIKDEKSLETIEPVFKRFKPEQLRALLDEPAGDGSGGGEGAEDGDRPMTRKEAAEFWAKQQKEYSRQSAMARHTEARKAEMARLSAASLKEAWGGDIPESAQQLAESLARGEYARLLESNSYPEDHDLYGQALPPLGERISEVFGSIKKFKELMRAEALSEIANKAANQPGAPAAKPGTGETTATVRGGGTDFGDALTQAALQGLQEAKRPGV